MKQIIYLDHHEKSVTGGHKYNDEFVNYLEQLSCIKVQTTPSCAYKYKGWRKIFSPFWELKYLKCFNEGSLVFFGDTTFKHHFLLALLNKWKRKSQSTMIVHHFPFIGGVGLSCKINKWLMCKYTSLMDSIIVPSPFTLDMAKSLFPNKRIYYVPLPFERKFQKTSNYEVGNLLYVGTIEERKGLSYLIDAISLLKNSKSIKLNIVGKIADQSYYNKLQFQIEKLGLSDIVCFLGRVSDKILEDCYQKAEIFTFPSLLEGYGIVLVEAFNNGLPIICFDNTAMPYTVIDGYNGFLVKNKDSKDFANKIKLLVGNSSLREQLQEGILKTVEGLKNKDDFESAIKIFIHDINLE
jgi:glycosyltransferase involved in cell wall biosynthesis